MNINQIKYLAVISMLCDHIAYAFYRLALLYTW